MIYDSAVHSDFLIHWTGKDIDAVHQPHWYSGDHRSRTPPEVDTLYLERLRNILTHGLWMTDEGDHILKAGSSVISVPATPQCSFTELKLSESRRHAAHYGRLGIGVKRPFLFNRLGRPLVYFGFANERHDNKFLSNCARELNDKTLLNFFKPMNTNVGTLNYDLYSESEWRLLYFAELVKAGKLVDPRDSRNGAAHAYFQSLTADEQAKLKYLIPLDGWFAMIIYPSLTIKNRVRWDPDTGVTQQIERIKRDKDDHANKVEGLPSPIRGNWPIEVHLDSCRHF